MKIKYAAIRTKKVERVLKVYSALKKRNLKTCSLLTLFFPNNNSHNVQCDPHSFTHRITHVFLMTVELAENSGLLSD